MRIILGSGKFFVLEFTGAIPQDSAIEVAENMLGATSGGASLEYKPTFYNAKDDLGTVQKSRLTDEEATVKGGVMTLNGRTFKKIAATATVDESVAGRRRVKIGGVKNDDGKKYLIRFLHEDEEDGDIRLTIVGRNEAGFTLAFAKDKETVVDLEFKAHPHDAEGTLVLYDEEDDSVVVVAIGTNPSDLSLIAGAIDAEDVLSCAATVSDGSTPTYQWYSNTTESNEGGSAITGATSATYAIPADTAAGTYYFYCVASSGCYNTTSEVATVTIAA